MLKGGKEGREDQREQVPFRRVKWIHCKQPGGLSGWWERAEQKPSVGEQRRSGDQMPQGVLSPSVPESSAPVWCGQVPGSPERKPTQGKE